MKHWIRRNLVQMACGLSFMFMGYFSDRPGYWWLPFGLLGYLLMEYYAKLRSEEGETKR